MKRNKIVIGSRGSKLALWQANWVKERLQSIYPELIIEIEKIKTTGDKILDAPLAKIGGKGLFVKEIEEALLSGKVDLAVHSMKDVPTEIPEGLHISAICEREDPKDALISKEGKSFRELPIGAVVGTSSLRRTIQIKALRKDLLIKPLRGNVDTRIRKLREGEFDAIVLALAGLKRMGLNDSVTEVFSEEVMIPAIGQGAIGIETRVDDDYVNKLINPLHHFETALCVSAERAFLSKMGGGCQVPLACHASMERYSSSNFVFKIAALIGDPESVDLLIKSEREEFFDYPVENWIFQQVEEMGLQLAEELLKKGGKDILKKIYQSHH